MCVFTTISIQEHCNQGGKKKEQKSASFPSRRGWKVGISTGTSIPPAMEKCEYSVTATVSLQMQSGRFFVAGSWTENPTSLP